MVFAVDIIKEKLGNNIFVQNINTVPKGHLRIETGFLYPDGSSIDVFLEQPDKNLLAINKPTLSDFGTTWSWLQNFEMKPNKSATQKIYFNSILENYNCKLNGAALETELEEDLSNLPVSIMRLGQACMRMADLIYSKRLKPQNNFNQDIEDLIVNIAPEYIANADIPLSNGKVVHVDFTVKGKKTESAIQTLSSANNQYAHIRAVDINARWDDLRDLSNWYDEGKQSITIFDDNFNSYDEQDLERLKRKSTLIPASNTETLAELLDAA